MRTIIDIPESKLRQIDEFCRREKLDRATLIRRAVMDFLDRHRTADAGEGFGIWKEHPIDALRHEHKLRDEWDW